MWVDIPDGSLLLAEHGACRFKCIDMDLQRVAYSFQGYTFLFSRRRSQVVRQESAKLLYTGSSPVVASAGMAELADARDLKSLVPKGRAGSTPAPGTSLFHRFGLMAQLVSALP